MSDLEALLSRDSIDERTIEEIEALKAILLDEIVIKINDCPTSGGETFPVVVESVVLPSTAADADQQYVRVTVSLGLPSSYPEKSPYVTLRNPRGLADEVLTRIEQDVEIKCADFRGQPVIYEIIELVKEHLTSSNCPSCVCAVCLFGFHQGDAFSKTECFHYFHSHCLACYIRTTRRTLREERDKLPLWQQQQMHKDRQNLHKSLNDEESESFQVPCPVCREPIGADLDSLSSAPPPIAREAAPPFELTKELCALQHQMAALYVHQKSRGGIIDVNADQSKLLLLTSGSAEGSTTTNSTVSADAPSSARSSRQLALDRSRGSSKSIRGSTWSSSSSGSNAQERSWNSKSSQQARDIRYSKNVVPVQQECASALLEAIEEPQTHLEVEHEEGNDDRAELRNTGKGGGGIRRGRGGGRWSGYHRSRGRRASSRGRLHAPCNVAPSS